MIAGEERRGVLERQLARALHASGWPAAVLAVVFTAVALTVALLGQAPSAAPRTPSAAYDRATDPIKAPTDTLQENIDANKEAMRRAAEYAAVFRVEDWKGNELARLGDLYVLAFQWANAERASELYLAEAGASRAFAARKNLLLARLRQQKYDAAFKVADELAQEPAYDQATIVSLSQLVDEAAPSAPIRAIALNEKMVPGVFRYAEDVVGRLPGHAGAMLEQVLAPATIYREMGNTARADAFAASFLVRFRGSPLSANKDVAEIVDSCLARAKMLGSPAPAIRVTDFLDLQPTSLADLRGRVVMLDFLAPWCAPCLAEIPEVNALQSRHSGQGLVVLGVTSYYGFYGDREKVAPEEERALVKTLKAARHAEFGWMMGPRDNEKAYAVRGLPAAALIDKSGNLRYLKTSPDLKELERRIQHLLAEPPPSK
jgi:cytochrome c biogenesis protein CcmG, thiol:disulfide interchange protein DsbE